MFDILLSNDDLAYMALFLSFDDLMSLKRTSKYMNECFNDQIFILKSNIEWGQEFWSYPPVKSEPRIACLRKIEKLRLCCRKNDMDMWSPDVFKAFWKASNMM